MTAPAMEPRHPGPAPSSSGLDSTIGSLDQRTRRLATTLLIVRDEALLYRLGNSDLLAPSEPAVIILDRREDTRRVNEQPAIAERRRRERRVNRGAHDQLKLNGYTVIRPES